MKHPKHKTPQKGAVLIAVLIFMFVLSFIVVQFVEEVHERLRYRMQVSGDEELRRIAYDCLEHSLAVLDEFLLFEGTLYSPQQGWGNPLVYEPLSYEVEGLDMQVNIIDETRKISLSAITEEQLVLLLEQMGIDGFEARRLRDTFFDWVDQDDIPRLQGAESTEYQVDATKEFLPSNQMIEELEELQFIIGFDTWFDPQSYAWQAGYYNMFKELVTLKHNHPVNLNSVNPFILEIISELDGLNLNDINYYKAGRDFTPGSGDDRFFTDINADAITPDLEEGQERLSGVQAHLLRIQIQLDYREYSSFYLEALVNVGASAEAAEPETPEQPETPVPPVSVPADPNEPDDTEEESENSADASNLSIIEISESYQDV